LVRAILISFGLVSIGFVQRGVDWIGFRWFEVSHFRSVYSYFLQLHFSSTLRPSQLPAASTLHHEKMDLNRPLCTKVPVSVMPSDKDGAIRFQAGQFTLIGTRTAIRRFSR
jgi:hypothetical protein